MKIPINEFELHIDEPILKKGLSYFKKGNVKEVIETAKGEFLATVIGTEVYEVSMSIKTEVITKFHCNCPYDQGILCKHVAAVIFYLQQEKLDITVTAVKSKSTKTVVKKTIKKKTIPEQVATIADQLEKKELVDFIKFLAETDQSFAQTFIGYFANKNELESIAYYSKQIKAIINPLANKNRYNWKNIGLIGKAVFEKFKIAMTHIRKGNYKTGVYICIAIMEEMGKALDYLDDSNADISSNVSIAFDALFGLKKQPIPIELRNEIFEYAVDAYKKQKYKGWDWHIQILKLAAEFKRDDKDVISLIQLIDGEPNHEYGTEELQIIRFKLLLHSGREQEANNYLEANLQNKAFRIDAIKSAIVQKNFAKAIRLAEDGIKLDTKTKPGYVKIWWEWLLEISLKQSNVAQIIYYARLLFMDHFSRKEEYYKIMKMHTPKDRWSEFVETMILESTQKQLWVDVHFQANIFIWEEQWNRLLSLVTQKPNFSYLEQYELPLYQHFPEQWKSLYAQLIIDFSKTANTRSAYKQVSKYLIKLIKKEGEENAQKIVIILRTVFKHRPALIEELKIFPF